MVYPRKLPWVNLGQSSLTVLGGGYLKKVLIPDSVLLVHSKIVTTPGDNTAPNKNGCMKMISPLIEIKNAS